jgi:hypothetical protein
MLSGEFERNLRKLNPKIRIFCGDNDKRPAGVWYYTGQGQYEEICGVDKNFVPELSTFDNKGHILKGGWRRVLRLLINKNLVDRRHAERLFRTHLEYMPNKPKRLNLEEHTRKLMERLAL